MSYDYAKDKNKKKPVKKNQKLSNRPALPGWVLFFSGVAFTVFAQFLFHLTQVDAPALTTNPEADITASEEPTPKKPTINFYNQLKTMEVKVPGDETKTQASNEATAQTTTGSTAAAPNQPSVESATQAISDTTNKTEERKSEKVVTGPKQFLQAGSYKTPVDADEQRAALSLLGVKANIETKPNADGTTYYRVMVGPFTSATELEKARSTLKNNSVPTITVKR